MGNMSSKGSMRAEKSLDCKESYAHCHVNVDFYQTCSGNIIKLTKGSLNNITHFICIFILNDNSC